MSGEREALAGVLAGTGAQDEAPPHPTAPESRDAQSGVAEVLLAHGVIGTERGRQGAGQVLPEDLLLCGICGWMRCSDYGDHLAAALGPVLAAERAKVWDEAIHEAEACGWLHDLAADDMAGRNPHHRADREQP